MGEWHPAGSLVQGASLGTEEARSALECSGAAICGQLSCRGNTAGVIFGEDSAGRAELVKAMKEKDSTPRTGAGSKGAEVGRSSSERRACCGK